MLHTLLQKIRICKPPFIGIDLGGDAIYALQLERTKNTTYIVKSSMHLPINNPQDDHLLLEALQTIAAQHPHAHIAAAIPSSLAITKTIQLDTKLTTKEINELLLLNGDKYLDCPLASVNFDFQISQTKQNEIQLVASRKESVLQKLNLMNSAGLTTKVIDIDIFALARAAQWLMGDVEFAYAVIHADQRRLLFCVIDNQEVTHFQGNYLHQPSKLSNIAEQVITNWQMHNSGQHSDVQKILLTGTYAMEPKFIEYLSKAIELPMHHNFSQIAPTLMVAIGLAFRKFDYAKF